MNYILINNDEIRNSPTSTEFEGYLHGDTDVSFMLVDMAPGEGVRLHKHPYKEIFIIQQGEATYVIGTETLQVEAGQVIVAPAEVPHKFVNSGQGRLRQVDLHLSERFIAQAVEE